MPERLDAGGFIPGGDGAGGDPLGFDTTSLLPVWRQQWGFLQPGWQWPTAPGNNAAPPDGGGGSGMTYGPMSLAEAAYLEAMGLRHAEMQRLGIPPGGVEGSGGAGNSQGGGGGGMGRRNRRAVLTPQQIALLESITGRAQADISGGRGFGLDPLAQGAYDNISRQFGSDGEFSRLGEQAGLRLLRGEPLIPYSDPGREQFYQEAFLNPAMENFRSDILPEIQEAYAGRGLEAGRSGDLLNAELTAGRRLATDLSAQRANLLRDDQDRALLGLNQAFNAASAPSEIAFNVGQQNRYLNNPYSNPAYGIAPLALGTQPYATRARGGGSNRNSLIGAGVGAGLGLLGNYLSGGNRRSGGGGGGWGGGWGGWGGGGGGGNDWIIYN